MSRRTSARKEISIEIDLVKVISIAVTVLMCVLFIFSAFTFIKTFMKIGKFELSGDCPYEKEELVTFSGLKYGQKLYSVDKKEVEKKLLAECPYIESIKVESKFPNKIKFTVECASACWYMEISGDYYALDAKMKVLEETYSDAKFKAGGITKLTLPDVKSAMIGTTLTYGDDGAGYETYEELMTIIKSSTLKPRLTLADIDNRLEIHFEIDGKYSIYAGSNMNIGAKLNTLISVLASDALKNCVSAEIDISDPTKNVSVRPVYVTPDEPVSDDTSVQTGSADGGEQPAETPPAAAG